jgi:sulfoxide reductase heme-binding subunit YedZ
MWYLTRGSGAVTLALLTASICLGISRRAGRVPRFALAALHRNLSLLAVVFLAVHVGTTLGDAYAPISVKDAVVPFLSSYRPIWLGLGAVACDLLLALIVTSLLRVRLGLRTWRLTHWLAYACWPVALLHSLGTGSDPRAGWLQALAAVCVSAVTVAVVARLARSGVVLARRLALGGMAGGLLLAGVLWYGGGPGAGGWAARAGTPASLLHASRKQVASPTTPAVSLPPRFSAHLRGLVTQSETDNGLVDVHLDGNLAGGVSGRLRVVLEGIPLDGGGVSMTSSGVAFAARGTHVFEGQIVGLQGSQVAARVTDGSGRVLELVLDLQLSQTSNALIGTVHGSLV